MNSERPYPLGLRFLLSLLLTALLLMLPGAVMALNGSTVYLPWIKKDSLAPLINGCEIFPSDNIWNTRVDQLQLDTRSSAYIDKIRRSKHFHADFGSGTWKGAPIGIPYTVISAAQPKVPISFDYDDESDPGPYPIPPNALIEGGPQSSGDRHVLLLDSDQCRLYEIYSAYPQSNGSWQAGSGAVYDLSSYTLRHPGWTSADAAGLPILPGLVRYEETAAGEIRHAIRFTAEKTQSAYVWPARHFASSLTDPNYPPMGQRFRLRADYPTTGFSPHARVILEAMKKYGLILADNGSPWFISGVPDEHWNNTVLHELDVLSGSDIQAVDTSSLMIQSNSGQARQP